MVEASLLLAIELFRATKALIEDVGSSETPASALGVRDHLIQDVLQGKIHVRMEDVTDWLTFLTLDPKYPSLKGYVRDNPAGHVLKNLQELIDPGC